MSFDTFLNIEGLPGGGMDEHHPGWIDVMSFSWGVINPGGGARAAFQDLTLVKNVDRSSPDLALACAEGRSFPTMVIEVARTSSVGRHEPVLRYRLHDCTITSLSPAGSQGGELIEQISIGFAEIEWTYAGQRPDGSLEAPIARSFSLVRPPQTDAAEAEMPGGSPAPRGGSAGTAAPTLQVREFVPNTAFIVMWMDAERPELEDVHLAIKDVCKSFGIAAVRADDIQHDERITDVILERIRTSEFVIADLTGERPNVYYEVGHAHAVGKRPMLFRRKGSALHFDLAVHNAREYKNVTELREMLTRRFEVLIR